MVSEDIPQLQGLEKIASWLPKDKKAYEYFEYSFFAKKKRIVHANELNDTYNYFQEFAPLLNAQNQFQQTYSNIVNMYQEQENQIENIRSIFEPAQNASSKAVKGKSIALRQSITLTQPYMQRIQKKLFRSITKFNNVVDEVELQDAVDNQTKKLIQEKEEDINLNLQEMATETNLFNNNFACERCLTDLEEIGKTIFGNMTGRTNNFSFYANINKYKKSIENMYEFAKDKSAIKYKTDDYKMVWEIKTLLKMFGKEVT